MNTLNRRRFLQTGIAGVAGLGIATTLKAQPLEGKNQTKIVKRKLGKTGIELPVLSMGVGACNSPSVVKGAMKLGIVHFDTAHVYQQGNSEKMLGEVLKEYPRDSFVIATKVKITDSKETFLKTLNESLERLQIPFVDILYLHAASSREDILNPLMLEAMAEAKSSGKAKHTGISTHKNEIEVLQAAVESNFYEVVLTAINFQQQHRFELMEAINQAANAGLGIVGMKVMAGGYLDKEKTQPVNCLAALKWVLQNENIHTTIPSMVNLEQLLQNAVVLENIELNELEKEQLQLASNQSGLYCNACGKCIPGCKHSLPVPELMRAYMYAFGYKETKKAKDLLVSVNSTLSSCHECSACTAKCVKGFDVPAKISEVSQLLSIPDEFLT
ncbi:MAG: aldo/keto reductase [Bacteroidota bacterium]|nr:MAG: aldo/keto reductase [Bacteroidota bacterium]